MPHSTDRLQLPESLKNQLLDFRRRVWTIKSLEAAGIAVFGVLFAFLSVFLLDRVYDTPTPVRLAVFVLALAVCTVVPYCLYRWIWRQRRLPQLAKLLSRKLPHVGDQLMGVIELSESEQEQARSRTLCAAAIQQVATAARSRDLRASAPDSRHRTWLSLATITVLGAIGLALFVPAAATSSWIRFAMPWQDTPRYTFAQLEAVPDELIVAHGEPFSFEIRLRDGSPWRPQLAQVRVGGQQAMSATLRDGAYAFGLPPQISPERLEIRVGDYHRALHLRPTLRPELTSIVADVSLPSYLGRTDAEKRDVRGGAIALVEGSLATFTATASRELSTASVDDQAQDPIGAEIRSPRTDIESSRTMEFTWRDELGLKGEQPFRLNITSHEDEPPTLACENLSRQRVVLDSEQLVFEVRAHDDFGVKQVGMEWQGVENAVVAQPAHGERMLSAGGHDQVQVTAAGTFSAASLEIEPQPIVLRVFAEDYFPGRERVYSPPYVLYVLNADQHAIWMTEQLSKWHRQSLEVRDREMRLYETNKELRGLPADVLDQADTRRRIENQASAERSNGRRLSRLASIGETLVRQASRNSEFGVGHLEKWAEMLQVLKDISANRMPSVADLLKEASAAQAVAAAQQSKPAGPQAGVVRAATGGSGGESEEGEDSETPPVPAIVDVESSQQPSDPNAEQPPSPSGQAAPRLTLPTTTLLGGGATPEACPASEKMEEAVAAQQDLLAEFERIADELNAILANLEGSTLVKRLKAASREQYQVAGRIGEQLEAAFGRRASQIAQPQKRVFTELAHVEEESSDKVSLIMDDMQAYFERRRFVQFKTVLDDMKEQDVVGGLRQLGEDIPKEHGLSIALCEYWSDSLDRWAEDLVDPASGGS